MPPGCDPQPVRRFGTITADLDALADWLLDCGVTTVAMERIFPSKKPWNFQYYPIFQLVARTWHALGVATKSPQIHIDLNGIC